MGCYVKKRFAIDSTSWTPIIAPVDCDMFWMKNIGAGTVTYLRTDPLDVMTEDHLETGYQESCTQVHVAKGPSESAWRFPAGGVILYAQADTGTGPLVVTFVQ
jgi:hypothetical protein